jgi:hypothetical protein
MSYFADYSTQNFPQDALTPEDKNILSNTISFENLMNANNQTERNTSLAELKNIFDNSTQKSGDKLVLAVVEDTTSGKVLLAEGTGVEQIAGHLSESSKERIFTEQKLTNGDFVVTASGDQAQSIIQQHDGSIVYQSDKGKTTHSADDSMVTIESGNGKVETTANQMTATFPDGVSETYMDVTPLEFSKAQECNNSWIEWNADHHFSMMHDKNLPLIDPDMTKASDDAVPVKPVANT